ncbi:unnamed protein product [Lathyrus sativus]|nr:unnamed protein product [Lathyrus sativus]
MALPIFSSLSFTCNKTLFPKNGSLSLPLWNSNFHRPIQCKGTTYEAANIQNQTVARPSFTFQPSIWNNDYIQSLSSEYKKICMQRNAKC